MKRENDKSIYLDYVAHNGLAILSMIMLTDVAMVCSNGQVKIPLYALLEYVPQAIIMVIAPFICYTTYFEPIPKAWKLKKYIVIGILFTISMIISIDLSIPLLETLYGSIEVTLLIYPIIFYLSLGLDLLNVYLKDSEYNEN